MEVGKKADNSEYGLQEDNILEIYAKLDPATNILTLHVLASGGKNTDSDNTRPDVWLNEAAKGHGLIELQGSCGLRRKEVVETEQFEMIPKFDKLMMPLFRTLKSLGGSGKNEEIINCVITDLNLPDDVVDALI
ncbi:MAG: hypothetical protein IJT89_02125 [Bacteroidaceae bacterium]|nr:hypothetical protein [Bacteroidaceae bacterium]